MAVGQHARHQGFQALDVIAGEVQEGQAHPMLPRTLALAASHLGEAHHRPFAG
jgi:hypothetical protein